MEQEKAQPNENIVKRMELGVAKAELVLAQLKGDQADIATAQKLRDALVDGTFSFSYSVIARIVFLTLFSLTAAFPTAGGGESAGAGAVMGKG